MDDATQNPTGGFIGALAADPAAAAPAAPAVTNLDAGENWGSESIPLDHPFQLRGVVHASFTFRTPTGLDVTRFYAAKKPSVVDFAIGLLGIDAAVFGAMHGQDSAKILKKAGGFLE